jgi:hypothetical protein
MNPSQKTQKIPKKIICEFCHYRTSNKKDYNKHLTTLKHMNTINTITNNNLSPLGDKEYICECGKKYKHNASLFNHKKKCIPPTITEETVLDTSSNEIKVLSNLVLEVIKNNNELQKQNHDLQQKMFELYKNNNNNNTIINTNSNNTTNNKTFNLQFFLNEECKDAMNMSEFINSIQLKISDLENIGKNGYVEGMSTIIIKHLNDTDVNKRPVHCSDAKRETLYIKEENKWEKDTLETKQMFKAVRGVDKKNCQLLTKWKETYPKCMDSKSHQSDDYMKVVSKVMDSDAENVNKVIKKVAKEVVIDK